MGVHGPPTAAAAEAKERGPRILWRTSKNPLWHLTGRTFSEYYLKTVEHRSIQISKMVFEIAR